MQSGARSHCFLALACAAPNQRGILSLFFQLSHTPLKAKWIYENTLLAHRAHSNSINLRILIEVLKLEGLMGEKLN